MHFEAYEVYSHMRLELKLQLGLSSSNKLSHHQRPSTFMLSIMLYQDPVRRLLRRRCFNSINGHRQQSLHGQQISWRRTSSRK